MNLCISAGREELGGGLVLGELCTASSAGAL